MLKNFCNKFTSCLKSTCPCCRCCCSKSDSKKQKNPPSSPLEVNNNTNKQEHQKTYEDDIRHCFRAFAGHSPFNKKTLYMSKFELQKFCEIVNINTPIDEIFEAIDSDVVDGQLTIDEFVDYFCNPIINPNCHRIQNHIEKQPGWILLKKALKVFEIADVDHSGKLEYNEFQIFGRLIALQTDEVDYLWGVIDKDQSGTITIDELFEWFRDKLHEQKDQIERQNGKLSIYTDNTNNNDNNAYNNNNAQINNDLETAKGGRIPIKDEDDDDEENENNRKRNDHQIPDEEKDEYNAIELGENVMLNKQTKIPIDDE